MTRESLPLRRDTGLALHADSARPDGLHPEWRAPLTLAVPDGAFFLLRTTAQRSALLFRLAVGLADVGLGAVHTLGWTPAALDRRALQRFRRAVGIGFVPHGLVSNLTLRMNVVTSLVYAGVATPDEAARRAAATLDQCGLGAWADARPADVPPDARQRAVIARAIARDPELLLLDNPIWALDTDEASELLAHCRARARTVIIAIQRRDETVARFADHSAVWDDRGLHADAA